MVVTQKKKLKKNPVVRSLPKGKSFSREKEPEYMVQVGEPKEVRKEILESLRELIIFMQGYEKFRKVQEEKVAAFATLRAQLKELNYLIDNQLKKCLPKGKLKEAVPAKAEKEEKEAAEEKNMPVKKQPELAAPFPPPEEKVPASELDELEEQLKDIENQLRGV